MNKTALGLGIIGAAIGIYALWPESEASAAEADIDVPDSTDDQQAAQSGPTSQTLLNDWKRKVDTAIAVCAVQADLAIAVDDAQAAFDMSYQSGSFDDNDRTAAALRNATDAFNRQRALCASAEAASQAAMRRYEASL